MDASVLAGVTEQLIQSAATGTTKIAWSLKAGDYGGSLTNTAEVIVGLCAAQPKLSESNPALAANVLALVASAREFVGDALVDEGQFDELYKYAFGLVAEIEASRLSPPLRVETVQACWSKMQAFRSDDGRWRCHLGQGQPVTLAALIAFRALVALSSSPEAMAALTEDQRQQCGLRVQELHALTGLLLPNGAVGELATPEAGGIPALTAAALYTRVRYLVQINEVPADPLTLSMCSFLSDSVEELKEDWSYTSPHSDYKVYGVAYAVAAMSQLVDYLDQDTLRGYYCLVDELSSDRMHYPNVAAYKPRRNSPHSPQVVWPSAYALWALAATPVARREARWIAERLQEDSGAVVPACPAHASQSIRWGKPLPGAVWLCMGDRRWVLTAASGMLVVTALVPPVLFQLVPARSYAAFWARLSSAWAIGLFPATWAKIVYVGVTALLCLGAFFLTQRAWNAEEGRQTARALYNSEIAAVVGTGLYVTIALALLLTKS